MDDKLIEEALHSVDAVDREDWLHTPLLSSPSLTDRSERDCNAILANRRARLTRKPSKQERVEAIIATRFPVRNLEDRSISKALAVEIIAALEEERKP